jgi:HAD superfamily hydrolase (TIGR01490 family)
MSKGSKLAIFDLDHTLLTGNSSYLFGLYLYEQGLFSKRLAQELVVQYCLHKMGLISMRILHLLTFKKAFQGKSLLLFQKHLLQFLEARFSSLVNKNALLALREHQSRGEPTALLSSSPDFVVNEIADRLNFRHSVGTTYHVDGEGRFSSLGNVLTGKEKLRLAFAWASSQRRSMEDVIAYSDSCLDWQLLSNAGVAVAVNPSRPLRVLAALKGWPVI